MAEYDELVEMLTFLLTKRLQAKLAPTRGLLGDGQGNTDVSGRDGFSFIRPDRSTSKVFEMFNKMAYGVDGTPILIGELPWQPGLIQVVGIDWETYMLVGWDSRFAGLAKHGNEHIWRDGQPGADTFSIFRRQMWPLRTEALGSGSTSVTVNPYDYINHAGSRRAWPGAPGIDLSAALPASSGSQRYALVYWDYSVSGSVYGQLGVATGTLAVNAPTITPPKPIEPTGAIPSAFVRLIGTQQTVTDLDIVDARPLWGDGSIFNIDRGRVSKLVSPDGLTDPVVNANNSGNVGIGTTGQDAKLDVLATTTQLRLTHTDASKFVNFTLDTNHDLTVNPSSTGQVIFQPTTDSVDFLQVLDADGGTPVLNIDTINERIGILTNAPTATLHLTEGYTSSTVHNATTITQSWLPTGTSGGVFPTTMLLQPFYDTTHTPASGFLTSFRLFAAISNSGVLSIRNIDLRSSNNGSSTVPNIFEIRARTAVNNGGGAITNYYGHYMEDQTVAANNYGIYQLGSGVINYLAGTLGVGTNAPQGLIHTHESISGFLIWEFDGLDATVRTIIPNGTGDVLYRLTAMYVLRDSAAAVASGTTDVSNAASVNLTVGGNTVRLRVNADGSTDVARTAGTDTIKVALVLRWL